MDPRIDADADRLSRLILGQLPFAEAERLATEYSEDDRLAELAEAMAQRSDTLLESLKLVQTPADSETDRMVGRLVEKLRKSGMGREDSYPTIDVFAPKEDEPAAIPEKLSYYRIQKVLGEGGMGTVFLAEDTRLGRRVALKTMKAELAQKRGAKDRFLREARSAAKLEHDHIIPIYDVGEADGVPFLAMPFLHGEPLNVVLQREKVSGRTLPVPEVVRIAKEMATGLGQAHAHGLIHRDIKPGNIWIESPTGRVKILDFGLARNQEDDTQHLTATGQVLGTPSYMAPEQGRGQPVDARADLFSLGCVLYEMLTGNRPFTGPDTLSILTSLAIDTPQAPHEINSRCAGELSKLTMQLLAKQPDQRPASAQLVVEALAKLEVGSVTKKIEPQDVTVGLDALPPVPVPTPVVAAQSRWPMYLAASLLMLLPIGWGVLALMGVVFRMETKDGTLIVELMDKDVEARIKNGELLVMDANGEEKYRLKPHEKNREKVAAGDYKITVVGVDGLTLDTKQFEMKKDGVVTVRVRIEPVVKKDEPKRDADRKAAEWVLSIGGTVRVNDQGKDLTALGDLPREAFRLTGVDLRNQGGVTEQGLAALKDCKHLTRFSLDGPGLTEAGLAHLKGQRGLEALTLGGPGVTQAGLAHFAGCTKLVQLQLSGKGITDAGLAHFAGCKTLDLLGLASTPITDASAGVIRGLTNLAELNVKGTGLSKAKIAELAKALPRCRIQHDGGIIEPKGTFDPGFFNGKDLAGWVDTHGKFWSVRNGELVAAVRGAQGALGKAKPLTRVVYTTRTYRDFELAFEVQRKGGLGHAGISFRARKPAGEDDLEGGFWVIRPGGEVMRVGTEEGDDKSTLKRNDLVADGFDKVVVRCVGRKVTTTVNGKVGYDQELPGLPAEGVIGFRVGGPAQQVVFRNIAMRDLSPGDSDRKAAEWVLSIGGTVRVNEVPKDIAAEDLPEKPFRLAAVNLAGNKRVSDAGLANLAGCKHLETLNLSETPVTDAGLAHFAGCVQMGAVNLNGTTVGDAGLAHFARCGRLSHLTLNGTRVTDAGLKPFAGSKSLIVLDLESTKVTDAGLAHVAGCENLTHLYVGKTLVSDKGVAHLAKCQNLTALSFDGTALTVAGLAIVQKLPKLTSLSLRSIKVTEVRLAELAKALPRCRIVRPDDTVIEPNPSPDRKAAEWVLSIGGKVRVNDVAKELAAVAELPKEPFRLTSVDLNKNQKATDGALAILAGCKELKDLNLNSTAVGDSGLAHFAECRSLRHLSLNDTQVTDKGLATFSGIDSLLGLSLYGTRVGDKGLAHFARCKSLSNLMIGKTPVTDAGLAHFADCTTLTQLSLPNTDVTNAGLANFAGSKKLQNLDLSSTKVTDDGLAHFAGCKELRSLALNYAKVGDKGLAHFAGCKKLEQLGLSLTLASDEGLAHFAGCKDLRGLALGGAKVGDKGLAHFRDCKLLTHLNLNGTSVTDAGLAHFAGCKNLQSLSLLFTQLGDAGLVVFRECRSLTAVSLGGNKMTNAGLAHFAECKKLEKLGLVGTSMTDACLPQVAEFKGLIELNLSKTNFTPARIAELASALPACQIIHNGGVILPYSLERKAAEWVLDRGGWVRINGESKNLFALKHLPKEPFRLTGVSLVNAKGVTDEGLAKLADCPGLTLLALDSPDVTDAGLAHFRGCKELYRLYLVRLKVTDRGLLHFRDCNKLGELSLHSTRVTDRGLAPFRDKKTLRVLILRDTAITEASLPMLRGFSNLVTLNLRDTKLPQEKILDLYKSMPQCRIEHDGGVIEAADLRAAKWVVSVGGSVRINGEPVNEIKDAAELPPESVSFRLTQVILKDNKEVTDEGMANLANCKHLVVLTLQGTPVGDAGLAHLADCKSLTGLNLSHTRVGDKGLTHFAGLPGLTGLALQGTRVTDAGLIHFANCKSLAYLGLSDTQVTDKGLALFAGCTKLSQLALFKTATTDKGLAHFRASKNLTELLVFDTAIGDASVPLLSEFALLGSLSVARTKLTPDGAAKLSAALPECKLVHDKGTTTPKPSPDRKAAEWTLKVGGKVWINDTVAIASVDGLPKTPFRLVAIDLRDNKKATDAGLAACAGCKHLASLYLDGTATGDAGLAHFAGSKGLRILSLHNTAVSDKGMPHFAGCKELTSLHLSNTQVTDEGLKHFAGSKNLEGLFLHNTTVTDEGMVHFAGCKGLKYLSLIATKVTDNGLVHFAECKHLQRLLLSHTKASDKGLALFAKCESIIGVLVENTAVSDASLPVMRGFPLLRYAFLQGTKMTPDAVAELSKALPECKITHNGGDIEPKANADRKAAEWVLSIGGAVQINAETRLIRTPNLLPSIPFRLVSVDLGGNMKVTDAGLAVFARCRHLRSLALSTPKVTDKGIVHFRECRNLTSLNLAYSSVTDRGLAHFAGIESLQVLALYDTAIGDAGLAHFANNKGLVGLMLGNSKVTDKGLAHFRDCKQLAHLFLRGTAVTDAGLAHFAGCEKVVRLDLSQTEVTGAGLANFNKCKGWTAIHLAKTKVDDAGLGQFSGFASLSELELDGTLVTDTGLARFAGCKNLTILNLIETKVSDAGLAAFADCKRLTRLYLSNTAVTDKGLLHFAGCKELETLYLPKTKISDAGVAPFADCPKLGHLSLENTPVTDACLARFAGHPMLAAVRLGGTKVTDDGMAHLADCRKLHSILLTNTQVGDNGLAHFVYLDRLTTLNLVGTKVTDAGLPTLARISSLTTLSVTNTKVSKPGLTELTKALPKCSITSDGGGMVPKK